MGVPVEVVWVVWVVGWAVLFEEGGSVGILWCWIRFVGLRKEEMGDLINAQA